MKKFTSLTFLACVLLFFVAVSAASSIDDDESAHVDKRNNVCPQQYKRNVLGRRNYAKKCPCALASSVFESKVEGIIVYAQDECGTTTVTGYIGSGLDDSTGNFTFQVVDDCDRVIRDLGTLGAEFVGGAAKPFAKKFTDFNLNCDKSGILFTKSAMTKRNYCPKTYYKRQGNGGSYTRIQGGSGATYGRASISSL